MPIRCPVVCHLSDACASSGEPADPAEAVVLVSALEENRAVDRLAVQSWYGPPVRLLR